MDSQETGNSDQHERNTQIEHLVVDVFGDEPKDPILGITDTVVIAPNLQALLERPSTIIVTIPDENGKLAGFNMAIPIGDMNPERAEESSETAYIYYTIVRPDLQGKGLIKTLTDATFKVLVAKGYHYVEEDTARENGYADKIERALPHDAILEARDHSGFPETGPQRFFRIDLSKVDLLN